MIVVDPHWWKTLFDEVYLLTDAPIVCNPPLTKREVNVVERALRLRPTDDILDLCGGHGRHALELARRGYQYVTVLDYCTPTRGLLRDHTYAERLYQPERLCTVRREAGLIHAKVHQQALVYKPDTGTDYGLATHRILITATKA